jgi:hypothetical protein
MMAHSAAIVRAAVVGFTVSAGAVAKAEDFQLPKEVTPAMRAACETDVRRLCIGQNPTVAKVKACVYAKFFKLGRRCQVELASAGFSR